MTPYNRERKREYMRGWRARVAAEGIPAHVRHGLSSTYTNYGCRCDLCRHAHVQYNREYMERKAGAAK